MTLNLEDLVVTSFATGGDQFALTTDPADPNEPTPATHCFVCPDDSPPSTP